MKLNQTRPFRRIDSDSQEQDIRSGDYLDAYGVPLISSKARETGVATPMVGCRLAYVPNAIVAGNKSVRLNLVSGPYTIRIVRNTNNIPFGPDITFTDTASAIAQIVTQTTSGGYPFSASGSNGNIQIIPNTPLLQYYDFKVIVIAGSLDVSTEQEAYDKGVEGPMKMFSGISFVSQLFQFSVSRYKKERNVPITSIQFGAGDIRVFGPDHGLVTGQEVFGLGFITLPSANGYYIVDVISPQVFVLRGAPINGGTYTFGQGKFVANSRTVGEIGVAEKQSDGTWKYVRIGRARGFNWKQNRRLNINIEYSVGVYRLYFSGDDNPYRAVRLKSLAFESLFTTNGYKYDSLSDQIRAQLSATSAQVEPTAVSSNGGALASGNYRFVARGRTSEQNAAPWGRYSNAVSIFTATAEGLVTEILGDDEGIITSKSIILRITDVDTDLYKFIEIGAVNYLNLGFDPTIVTRIELVPGQSVYEYLFTGNEVETQPFDPITINIEPKFLKKNVAQANVDNRMFLGFPTYQGDPIGLEAMLDGAKYRLRVESLPFQGYHPNITLGGYQTPDNVRDKTTFVFNETYRISVRYRWRDTGAFTKCYFFADIKIDLDNTSTDGRRDGSFQAFRLSSLNSMSVPYIDIYGINLDYLYEGRPIKEQIDRAEVMIAELTTRTILASGLGVNHIKRGTDSFNSQPYERLQEGALGDYVTGVNPSDFIPSRPISFAFESVSGFKNINGVEQENPYSDLGQGDRDLRRITFQSGDLLTGQTSISFLEGDKIIKLGDYDSNNSKIGIYGTDLIQNIPCRVREVYGLFVNQQEIDVKGVIGIERGGEGIDVDDVLVLKKLGLKFDQPAQFGYEALSNPEGLVITLDSDLEYRSFNAIFGAKQIGAAYIQYYRPTTTQYPVEKENTLYQPTGFYLDVNEQSAAITETLSLKVFGGDAFLYPIYQKILDRRVADAVNGNMNGVVYYSQGIANWNMRRDNPFNDGGTFPAPDQTISLWLTSIFQDAVLYNSGYNVRNQIQLKIGFDPNNLELADFPTRILYTDINIQETDFDGYRELAPLNARDLKAIYGPISNFFNINGELYSMQATAFSREYVNTYGTNTSDQAIVQYIGDGNVLSRPGTVISTYGGRNPFNYAMGKTQGGDDQLAFIDEVSKVLVRFGADGSVPQSDISSYRTKVFDLTKFARFCTEPGIGNGIHGGWNKQLGEFIFMVRCRRKENFQWEADKFAFQGDLVTVEDDYANDFEQTVNLYEALQGHNTTFDTKPGSRDSPLYWRLVALDEADYYTKEGIVVSQYASGFVYRTPFVNNIMVAYDDTLVSAHPKILNGGVYEHNVGKYLTFYDDGTDKIEAEGYVEMVFNADAGQEKLYQGLTFTCEDKPFKVELRTKGAKRTIFESEFEQMVDRYYAPIGNDDSIGPDQDSTALFGEYLVCRFYFKPDSFQRLSTAFVSYMEVARRLGR